MNYLAYANKEYFKTFLGDVIPDEEIEKRLYKASRNIDSLTFNRIVGSSYDNLTDFQKELIKATTCMLAQFEYENEELIENVLNSYSINGVSMDFSKLSPNVSYINGVVIKTSIYSLLKQTGLTARGI